MGLRTELDVLEKRKVSCFCSDSNSGPSISQRSRCTDYANNMCVVFTTGSHATPRGVFCILVRLVFVSLRT